MNLIERLRAATCAGSSYKTMCDAADEIERLTELLKNCRAAADIVFNINSQLRMENGMAEFTTYDIGEYGSGMDPHSGGDWVCLEDAKKAVDKKDKEIERLMTALQSIGYEVEPAGEEASLITEYARAILSEAPEVENND